MSSEVEICNLALSALGSGATIASLDEASTEAGQCKLHFANARDSTLEGLDWRFARRAQALALLGTPPEDWDYSYALPADCIRPLSLVQTTRDTDPPPFELVHDDTQDATLLLTDAENAILRYTARVTNTTLFSPLFVQALAMNLAMRLALPLTQDKELFQLMRDNYAQALLSAEAAEKNTGQPDPARQAPWIEARA